MIEFYYRSKHLHNNLHKIYPRAAIDSGTILSVPLDKI